MASFGFFTPLILQILLSIIVLAIMVKLKEPTNRRKRAVPETNFSQHLDVEFLNFTYPHPDNPSVRGRTFSGLLTHSHILEKYLNAPTITIDPQSKIEPQLVTAASANHFQEHLISIRKVFLSFPRSKILFYDLGLEPEQKKFIMGSPRYIYKKLDFKNYPEKTSWLRSMAFKIFILAECLAEFGACTWFDTSIIFVKSSTKLVNDFVYKRNSSFVYFIKPTGHSSAWATHPLMYAYFPSNITRMNQKNLLMNQGGAEIIYNTRELQQGVMKWAIACALTPECLMPNYELDEHRIKFGSRHNPWGSFSLKYCDPKNDATRPFNCHRFDQSLFNILVTQMYDYDETFYRPDKIENIAFPDRTIGKTVKLVIGEAGGGEETGLL